MPDAFAFTASETLVSREDLPMPDPEFDQAGFQVAWQDKEERLWVANVLPSDGTFDLDHAIQLDVNLAPISYFRQRTGSGNGPEWVYTDGESQILYTKAVGPSFEQWEVYRAKLAAAGWSAGPFADASSLPYGRKGLSPLGSLLPDDANPTVSFLLPTPVGDVTTLAWRKLNQTFGTIISTEATDPGRWFAGEPKMLVFTQRVQMIDQVFLFDATTLTKVQLTFGPATKSDPFLFAAPEYGNALRLVTTEEETGKKTVLRIYEENAGIWKVANTIRPPTLKKDLRSAEPQIFNGQSYITVVAEDKKDDPSEIWLLGIRSDTPFSRRVSQSRQLARNDPEFLVTPSQSYIYFSVAGLGRVYRCETGLGPPVSSIIVGTWKADNLVGTTKNDRITGGWGNDKLTGGKGADQFVFEQKPDRQDVINDFTLGDDLLDLRLLIAGTNYGGNNPLQDGYVQCTGVGQDTHVLINPDGAGPEPSYLLVIVKKVAPDKLKKLKNFIF